VALAALIPVCAVSRLSCLATAASFDRKQPDSILDVGIPFRTQPDVGIDGVDMRPTSIEGRQETSIRAIRRPGSVR
jgi:hypothetical protein